MKLTCWTQTPHTRIYPTGNAVRTGPLRLDAARGETVAFQAGITFDSPARGLQTVEVRFLPDAGSESTLIRALRKAKSGRKGKAAWLFSLSSAPAVYKAS